MMRFSCYCRSMLCTPALAVERLARAAATGPDIALVDLEDSVATMYKAEARTRAVAFFSAPAAVPGRRAVRVNALTDPEGLRDLLALRGCPYGPDIVVIPKVESPRDVEIAGRALGEAPELMAVIETPRGLENVTAIITARAALRALVFGSADFALSIGASLGWQALAYARARLVATTRAAGLHPIDSPWFDIDDDVGLAAEAERAREIGFGGMVALHPRQVPIINRAFSPDKATIERARRIVTASQDDGRGIYLVDGIAAGAPFVEAARRLLREFDTRPDDGGATVDATLP